MTGSETPAEHDCEQVLTRVYEFLDHELDDASGDAIRTHLAACEPCLERFDVEQAVKALVSRCCGNDKAPDQLRSKVMNRISELSET
ncbi:mycothiol system anti-sigma-R factor [Microlunatus sp. GCM10028923]|uniref:mycothiol system anti-sigma-R factor n=1 Tax=Microlunatus sp. GCM10028923 TaxID=3273400 RepID=UPI0036184489